VLVCVGEASGDRLAASALEHLDASRLAVRGIAGPALRARGVHADLRAEDLGGVGLVEVLGAIRRAPAALARIAHLLDTWRPDLLWTVDNPGLNLRLGSLAKRRGVPAVHLVSPQVWAWRPGRVRRVARSADAVLCLLPFEPAWYAGTGVVADFVGHPAAWPLGRSRVRGDGEPPVLALAPGSRPAEIAALWPTFREAARALRRRRPDLRVRVAVAPTVSGETLAGVGTLRAGLRAAVVDADVALVAAGTATLECAAAGVPFVAAYRVHPLTWALGRRLVRSPFAALPNVVAGERLVPEHLQHLDPEVLAADLARLLGSEGDAVARRLSALAAGLRGEGASERIAAALTARLPG